MSLSCNWKFDDGFVANFLLRPAVKKIGQYLAKLRMNNEVDVMVQWTEDVSNSYFKTQI